MFDGHVGEEGSCPRQMLLPTAARGRDGRGQDGGRGALGERRPGPAPRFELLDERKVTPRPFGVDDELERVKLLVLRPQAIEGATA